MEGLESFFSSGQQFFLFIFSCFLGLPLGVFYDLFRVLRITFPHKKTVVVLEDILFFIVYGIFIMCFTVIFARSEFRFFYCLGNLIGFILYYVTIGKFIIKVLKWIILHIKGVIKKIILTCKKYFNKFVGSFQIIKIRKKNRKNP